LIKSLKILSDIEGIALLQLNASDVVRHRLVKQIIEAYDKHSPPPS
jgi:phosphate starvation-inducible PhoH-like protein